MSCVQGALFQTTKSLSNELTPAVACRPAGVFRFDRVFCGQTTRRAELGVVSVSSEMFWVAAPTLPIGFGPRTKPRKVSGSLFDMRDSVNRIELALRR